MVCSLLQEKYVVPKTTTGEVISGGKLCQWPTWNCYEGILGYTEISNIWKQYLKTEFGMGNYFEVANYFGVGTYFWLKVIYMYCCYLIRLQCGLNFTANQIRTSENWGVISGRRTLLFTWFTFVSLYKFSLYFIFLHRRGEKLIENNPYIWVLFSGMRCKLSIRC